MSFFGRFFGAGKVQPFTGNYHTSVYQRYSRGGGSENAVGTLGKAFAYKRPKLAQGGNVATGKMTERNNPYKRAPKNAPARPPV